MSYLFNVIKNNKLKYQLNLSIRKNIISKKFKTSLIEIIPLDVLSEVLAPLILKKDYENLIEAYKNEKSMRYLGDPYIIRKTRQLIRYPNFNRRKMAGYVPLGHINFIDIANRNNIYKLVINANLGIIRIGNHPDNDIILNGEGIAEFHAFISLKLDYSYAYDRYELRGFDFYNIAKNEVYISRENQWRNVSESNMCLFKNVLKYQLKIGLTIFDLEMSDKYDVPSVIDISMTNSIKLTQITAEGEPLSYPMEFFYKVGYGSNVKYNLHIGRYIKDISERIARKIPYIGVVTDNETVSKIHLIISLPIEGMRNTSLFTDNLVYINSRKIKTHEYILLSDYKRFNNGWIIRLGDSDVYFKFEYIKN